MIAAAFTAFPTTRLPHRLWRSVHLKLTFLFEVDTPQTNAARDVVERVAHNAGMHLRLVETALPPPCLAVSLTPWPRMYFRLPSTIALWLIAGLLCFPIAVLSAHPGSNAEVNEARYRLTLRATQTANHELILAASTPLVLGRANVVRTKSSDPAENHPAVPSFTATLSPSVPAGGYELVTRVVVRESLRNKKGKLKITRRNIGSLLPIRLGEPQTASAVGDPITLEWRVERR